MVIMAGLTAAAGSAASGLWGQLSTPDFMQNYLPDALTAGRNMAADQKLNRKYFEIEMKIERQNLHRDDIQDLMELTVGRMDIYHVVGTLLLTFCIEWFTNMDILKADLPDWFRVLFLISNYSAVGYLLFSVWLAMHASIVAHSVGVRLRTSFARLTIPSREDLKKLRVHLVPRLDEFMSLAKRYGLLGPKGREQEQSAAKCAPSSAASATAAANLAQGSSGEPDPETTSDALGVLEMVHPAAGDTDLDTGEDDYQHFDRYIQEQRTWLGYDAYARVCMSLGMNQMLQALSYYVVGVLAGPNLFTAMITFFGVKGIAFYLLRLDITGMGDSWREYLLVVFFMGMPSFCACAGFLLLQNLDLPHEDLLVLLVTPCFILHGCWILYVALDIDFFCCPYSDLDSRSDGLPRRIRTVQYLDVCSDRQRRLAREFRVEDAREHLVRLQTARDALGSAMQTVMKEEEEDRLTAARATPERNSTEVQEAQERLSDALDAGRLCGAAGKEAEQEFELASKAMEKSRVWQQAPQIHAALRALKDESVRGYLSDEQVETMEVSYVAFVQQCHTLGIDIPALAAKSEQPRVRFSATDLEDLLHEWWGLPESVWITPGDPGVSWEKPGATCCTSFTTAMGQAEEWRASAEGLTRQLPPPVIVPEEPEGLTRQAAPPMATPDRPEGPVRRLMPSGAVPDLSLPQKIVHRFTKATAFWWWVAAAMHVFKSLHFGTLVASTEASPWQEGRGAFFEIESLNCNATHLLLSDRFAIYAAKRHASGLAELGQSGIATELSWLRGLDPSRGSPLLQLPPSWRITAAAWQPCAAASNATCEDALVAGWDGSSVVVAAASLDAAASAWRVRPQFRVNHQLGKHLTLTGWSSEVYDDVRALHLDPDGRALTVLLGTREFDMWDLAAGVHLGRWRLPGDYTAICRTGAELLLVRQDEGGPVLQLVHLPAKAIPPAPPAQSRASLTRDRQGGFLEV